MSKAFKEITVRLIRLSRPELRELIDIIQSLLIADLNEQNKVIKSRYDSHPAKGSAGGHIEKKMIRGYGPYLYLRYRSGGKLKSVYIGKGKS